MAWGDINGDGQLDLVVGNFKRPARIYLNDGGMLSPNAAWSSDEADITWSVALGDTDGDGDLDLATGNAESPNRLYRNQGGTFAIIVETELMDFLRIIQAIEIRMRDWQSHIGAFIEFD